MFCKKSINICALQSSHIFLTLDSLFMWFLADMAYKTEEISQTIFRIMSAYIYEYCSLLRCTLSKRYLLEAEIIKGKLNTSFQLPDFA